MQQVIPVPVVWKFILKTKRTLPKRFGMPFLKREPQGLKPIGLAARDTLRLEMGFCLYGNDIDDTTIAAGSGPGLDHQVQQRRLPPKTFCKSKKKNGVERKLVGFEMIDHGIPRHGYEICNEGGETDRLCYIRHAGTKLWQSHRYGLCATALSSPDSSIFIKVRDKLLAAKVVKMPFA